MHKIAWYNNKPIWSGIVNVLDNVIEEAYPFSTARNAGFHHTFYISPEGQDKMDDGSAAFFFIDDDNGKPKVTTMWREQQNPELEKALSQILDLSDTTDYDNNDPEYERQKNTTQNLLKGMKFGHIGGYDG